MGELTDVASAKRAVLGVLMERADDELDEVLGRAVTCVVLIFSSVKFRWRFDMLSSVRADVGRPEPNSEWYLYDENQLTPLRESRKEADAEPVAKETQSKMQEIKRMSGKEEVQVRAGTLGFMWLKRQASCGPQI